MRAGCVFNKLVLVCHPIPTRTALERHLFSVLTGTWQLWCNTRILTVEYPEYAQQAMVEKPLVMIHSQKINFCVVLKVYISSVHCKSIHCCTSTFTLSDSEFTVVGILS